MQLSLISINFLNVLCISAAKLLFFPPGYEYEYSFNSTIQLELVDTLQLETKISFVSIKEHLDGQELFLKVSNFRVLSLSKQDVVEGDKDFSRWFSFVISNRGEISKVYYASAENAEVIRIKKILASLLSSKLHVESEITGGIGQGAFSYLTEEMGHDGIHKATYKVMPSESGIIYTKIKESATHPVTRTQTTSVKTLHFIDELEAYHRIVLEENMTTSNTMAPGFDPFFAMRKVNAVNNFDSGSVDYPDMNVFTNGELHYLTRHAQNGRLDKPEMGIIEDDIVINLKSREVARNHLSTQEIFQLIQGNISCIKQEPEKGSKKLTDCFCHLLELLKESTSGQLVEIGNKYFSQTSVDKGSRMIIFDAFNGLQTVDSQKIILNTILSAPVLEEELLQRFFLHMIQMNKPPVQEIIDFLMGLFTREDKRYQQLSSKTSDKLLLTIGSMAKILQQSDANQSKAIVNELHTRLGIYDPWNFKNERSSMTLEEQQSHEVSKVILLEALGNAAHEDSFEYILSHVNTTNSPWIKRAGLHALRHYHHSKAANVLLHAALEDDDDNVRYEALLQYQAHPKSAVITPLNSHQTSWAKDPYDSGISEISSHSRNMRSVFDLNLHFRLAAPSVDWQKRIGSSSIGASFGVVLKNTLDIKVEPLSGDLKIDVYDEAYARIHLGILGINLDYFSARLCFRGEAEYYINVFQELDILSAFEQAKRFSDAIQMITKRIKNGVDAVKALIDGDISLKRIIQEFIDALENLPDKVAELRDRGIRIRSKLSRWKLDKMPSFIQPVLNLVNYVTNLYDDIRNDVMAYYKTFVEAVTIQIPHAGEQLFAGYQGIQDGIYTILKDPIASVTNIGMSINRMQIAVKQLIEIKKKFQDLSCFSEGVKPYWMDLSSQYEKILDLGKTVKTALEANGRTWLNETSEEINSKIKELTQGNKTLQKIKQSLLGEIEYIVDELITPFDNLAPLGLEFLNRFIQVFDVVTAVKDAWGLLKEAYTYAKTAVTEIFGTKCHSHFPKKTRLRGNDCQGSGFYPSQLGIGGLEYRLEGVDILIAQGQSVVAPFSGYLYKTGFANEIAIRDIRDLSAGTEIIITNILLQVETDRRVDAGERIGIATQSPCRDNHIHVAMLRDKEVIEPTQFMQSRPTEMPTWHQFCDDYRLVEKFQTVDAGRFLGPDGKSKDDITPAINDNIDIPDNLDPSFDPAEDIKDLKKASDSLYSKLQTSLTGRRRRSVNLLESLGDQMEMLINQTAQFLERFSLRDIKMGAIVNFLDYLKLEESKQQMAKTIRTVRDLLDNKKCENPNDMSQAQLQNELTSRGIDTSGTREQLIQKLTIPDLSCPMMALMMPGDTGHMYCLFDSMCLGLQCCLTLEMFDLFQLTYKAFIRFDPCTMQLSFGIDDSMKVIDLIEKDSGYEDYFLTGIDVDLLDNSAVIVKYKIQTTQMEIVITFGIGVCRKDDPYNCITVFNVLESAVIPFPTCENGKIKFLDVDWSTFFSKEAVLGRLAKSAKEVGKETAKVLQEEIMKALGLPLDFLATTQPCKRPETMTDKTLVAELRGANLETTGSRGVLQRKLTEYYHTCTVFGKNITLPSISSDFVYYYISKNCMRLDVCIDFRLERFNYTKSFSAYLELDPCNFVVTAGFEHWSRSEYLIDYAWGTEKFLEVTDMIQVKYNINKNDKSFIINLGLKVKDLEENVLTNEIIPIPVCNENFTLPGKGDLAVFAKALGGSLTEKSLDLFLKYHNLDGILLKEPCIISSHSACSIEIDIPDALQDALTCVHFQSCQGVKCCFGVNVSVPFIENTIPYSIPFWFELDTCIFKLEYGIGSLNWSERIIKFEWGREKTVHLGSNSLRSHISYVMDKHDSGFIMNAKLTVCLPLDGQDSCILEDISLMNNVLFPICNVTGSLPVFDFSLEEWMKNIGLQVTEQLTDVSRNLLIEMLGLKDHLLPEPCDIKRHPYSPAVDGWNNDCKGTFENLPELPDFLACNIPEHCTGFHCCLNIEKLGLSVQAFLDIDTCRYTITGGIENKTFNYSFINFNWGEEQVFSILNILNLRYTISVITREKNFAIDLDVEACFEKNGRCLIQYPLLNNTEVPQPFCSISNSTGLEFLMHDFWKSSPCVVPANDGCSKIQTQWMQDRCFYTKECQEISCCYELSIGPITWNVTIFFGIDHCKNKVVLGVENKQIEMTIPASGLSKNIYDTFHVDFKITETATARKIDLNFTNCWHKKESGCTSRMLLRNVAFAKSDCNTTLNRKKRGIAEDFQMGNNIKDFKSQIRSLINRDPTEEEMKQFIEQLRRIDQEQKLKNLEKARTEELKYDGIVGFQSMVNALGSRNPTTLIVPRDTGWEGSVTVTGNDVIQNMLGRVNEVMGRANQLFIVGQGLSGEGVRLLGTQLANFSIGDLEALLEVNKINPLKVNRLIKDLRDLVRILYSEVSEYILSGITDNIFKALDIKLTGHFSFPRKEALIFYHGFPIAVGPVVVWLEFGSVGYFGIDITLTASIMGKKATATVTPYAGLQVWGSASVGSGLTAELRLRGYIMTISFPTTVEIGFSKFPLDVGLEMYLDMIPLQLELHGIVRLRIPTPWKTYTITIFKARLWYYTTPSVRSTLVNSRDKEPDETPPKFSDPKNIKSVKREVRETSHTCAVRQLDGLDYTEPAFEIQTTAVSDDRSKLRFFLNIGIAPGGSDVIADLEIGGTSIVVSKALKATGVPLYFTVTARNNAGASTSVYCDLLTYDITLPSGRLSEGFISTSNPVVLKASVVVHEDSPLQEVSVGVGFGKDIYGEQMVSWNKVDLKDRGSNAELTDVPENLGIMKYFTPMKNGRLICPTVKVQKTRSEVHCAQLCLELPDTKCLSFNFDFGRNSLCEILEYIDGHDFHISEVGYYSHYERLGIGYAVDFVYDSLHLEHNKLYFFNLDMINSLGYRKIISSKGILADITPPETGPVANAVQDILERIPCQDNVPYERQTWVGKYCIDQSDLVKNHRVVIDGPGSSTVFNGGQPLSDLRYTRANNYVSANWDGFADKEAGILGYSWSVGTTICGDEIDLHRDPHFHLLSVTQWTHSGQLYPIPTPTRTLPDGTYYITVRAFTNVQYGGLLSTTVCHTTPYVIDISPPILTKVYNIKYNIHSHIISAEHDARDPDSGISELDICLGQTSRDCNILVWTRYPYVHNIEHKFEIPPGMPVWIRVRALNNVNLRTVAVADNPIIIDHTPPIAGKVFDGSLHGHDLVYTKDNKKVCASWKDFYDLESGIKKYLMGVGSEPGKTDVADYLEFIGQVHEGCVWLAVDKYLEHGKTYYVTITAFNRALKQKSVTANSNGVFVDLTGPERGVIIDGWGSDFTDIHFSTSRSIVGVQWKNFSDPESQISMYNVQVMRKRGQDWDILKEWTNFDNTDSSAVWRNVHVNHKDEVKSVVRTTNGALNTVEEETDGFTIDLTPPTLKYVGDGTNNSFDLEYQSYTSKLSAYFELVDEESGIYTYKFQVYEMSGGRKLQILPASKEQWLYVDNSPKLYQYTIEDLSLKSGSTYLVRVGAQNNAGLSAAFDTNGVVIDTSSPEIHWLHVGSLAGEEESEIDGYVWQSDKYGIQLNWFASDTESGIKSVYIAVGTQAGSDDVSPWQEKKGDMRDFYISGLDLHITDTSTSPKSPVYFVTVKMKNGADLMSNNVVSTPIIVVEADKPGIVLDGYGYGVDTDVDYQYDSGTVTMEFTGFESSQSGITRFEWAVGETVGGEEIQPFITAGIVHEEIENGSDIIISGYGQNTVQLKQGSTYFTTVRAITNEGNVIESSSNGFVLDMTPPELDLYSLCGLESGTSSLITDRNIYFDALSVISATWSYNETEDSASTSGRNFFKMWYTLGSYPQSADLVNDTYTNPSKGSSDSVDVDVSHSIIPGKPSYLNVWATNKAGLTGTLVSSGLTVDKSPPIPGTVSCPKFVQDGAGFTCTWFGFYERESQIRSYRIFIGRSEGSFETYAAIEISKNHISHTFTDLTSKLLHGERYFVTVEAVNEVNMKSSAYSTAITIDNTPPTTGIVIEISQTETFNTSASADADFLDIPCKTQEECETMDNTCQESFTSLSVAWQAFLDAESGIQRYQLAVGTTPGGIQVLAFMNVPTSTNHFRLHGLNLYSLRQVYVSVRGINGAGLSSISTSNGIYLSYLSQELEPLSPIGIWDADPNVFGDIDIQSDLSSLSAAWDVSGDPCPVAKYEWAVERMDGVRVQEFFNTDGATSGTNDRLSLAIGECYYSLLRVTNVAGFVYTLRSDGVTLHRDALIPGYVYDGDVEGYDLDVSLSISKASANWRSFGVQKEKYDIITGNAGDETEVKKQEIFYYEVALGSDRRFQNTRTDVKPFTNVGNRTSYTFVDLDLTPGAVYYFTVRAYRDLYATAVVTSNGFYVGLPGNVTAGEIIMPRYVRNETYLDIQWRGFSSTVDMLMYYVALSSHNSSEGINCRHYVDGGRATEEQKNQLFDVHSITNVGSDTYVHLTPLSLKHSEEYFAWVIGIDTAGECGFTMHLFGVDITPPGVGSIRAGPYFNLPVSYTSEKSSLTVSWTGFDDSESKLKMIELSLLKYASCTNETRTAADLVTKVILSPNETSYVFIELDLQEETPYKGTLAAHNNAGDVTSGNTPFILYDNSVPTAGRIIDGTDYLQDRVWFSAANYITGSFLHQVSKKISSCAQRRVSMTNRSVWKPIKLHGFVDATGKQWNIEHREANIQYGTNNEISIKLSRDTKKRQMYSAAYYTKADIYRGGTYEISVKAADGDGKAVTGISFWDGPTDEIAIFDYDLQSDLSLQDCDCCYLNQTDDCTCSCNDQTFTTTMATTLSPKDKNSTAIIINENKRESFDWTSGKLKKKTFVSQTSCGVQIYGGDKPYVVVWCQFFNDSSKIMTTSADISFDPTKGFHRYKIDFFIKMDDIEGTNCLNVYADEKQLSDMCGIPELSNSTQLVLHVWSKNNIVPEISAIFNEWSTKATFRDLIMPPKETSLCRYGHPFIPGNIPAVRVEAGIGTTPGLTDVVEFKEVLTFCVPCSLPCTQQNCDANCTTDATTVRIFNITNINLEATVFDEMENKSVLANYFTTVKMVLPNSKSVIASSNGFYIDKTPPNIDHSLLIYIDVVQGEYKPVEFQSSRDTIKAIWVCEDLESQIEENFWAIGTYIGGEDVQSFTSVGKVSGGTNSSLGGILQDGKTYYVTIKCKNGADGISTWTSDKGVTVIFRAPDVESFHETLENATDFDEPVVPSNAKQSPNGETISCSWTESSDPSVERYDFCVGSSADTTGDIDNIFPCTWVGYNASGTVNIENGYLTVDGHRIAHIAEIQRLVDNSTNSEYLQSQNNVFRMEPGRTMHIHMRICNKANLCSVSHVGSVVVKTNDMKFVSSRDGSSIKVSGFSTRSKRSSEILSIKTTDGLLPGQSILASLLTEEQMATEYRSDASFSFVSYISNPAESSDLVSRILVGRMHSTEMSFIVVPIGGLELPGPLSVTYSHEFSQNETVVVLVHWNPGMQRWELSNTTCENENDTFAQDPINKLITVKVCNTRNSPVNTSNNELIERRQKRSTNSTQHGYLSTETQFALANISIDSVNNPPNLISETNLEMLEDEGTLYYKLVANDPENDPVIFKLNPDMEMADGNISLSSDGILRFMPCKDCFGNISIAIILEDKPGIAEIEPTNRSVVLNIEVKQVNDPPVVFLLNSDGRYALKDDPTEPYIIMRDQMKEGEITSYSWLLGAYDVDKDNLTILMETLANGTFTVYSHATSSIPSYFSSCSESPECIAVQSSFVSLEEMTWYTVSIEYHQNTTFTGSDVARFVFRDNDGHSDVVTVQINFLQLPCENGGQCLSIDESLYPCYDPIRINHFEDYYTCACSPGWTGTYCETDVDECASSPCAYYFICRNQQNKYKCVCPPDKPLCEPWAAVLLAVGVTLVVVGVIVIIYCRNKHGKLTWIRTWTKKQRYGDFVKNRIYPKNEDERSMFGSSDDMSSQFWDPEETLVMHAPTSFMLTFDSKCIKPSLPDAHTDGHNDESAHPEITSTHLMSGHPRSTTVHMSAHPEFDTTQLLRPSSNLSRRHQDKPVIQSTDGHFVVNTGAQDMYGSEKEILENLPGRATLGLYKH